MEKHDLPAIDLVAVNLYPFEATIAAGADRANAIENIDIGGPALIRSAAKNHAHVAVLTDPAQYPELIEALESEGGTQLVLRRRLAAAAYARTASYDAAIAAWAARQEGQLFPERMTLAGRLAQELRYGENPHQKAAFYVDPQCDYPSVSKAEVLHGKELSYNNLLDLDSALALVRTLPESAAVVIMHNNPCGAAAADSLADSMRRAASRSSTRTRRGRPAPAGGPAGCSGATRSGSAARNSGATSRSRRAMRPRPG